jgi:hypothetical protein
MLNTLARMLYDGERFEWAEAGTSSWLANVRDVNEIMFGITVDARCSGGASPSYMRSTAGNCSWRSTRRVGSAPPAWRPSAESESLAARMNRGIDQITKATKPLPFE